MNYPLLSEYIESIRFAEDNLASLTYLRPVMDEDSNPIFSSGNFAVVFKMQDIRNGDYKALKCFTKDQEGRASAYKEISKVLCRVESKYLINFEYLEYELYVDKSNSDENEFPVLLMDWIEGETLNKYVKSYIGNSFHLDDICLNFRELSQWILNQPFAHGDIKPDNILVRRDGSMVLVDYDGMYVPAMKGQNARELGSPDYRHPLQNTLPFDEHIDDFSLASIALSLKTISVEFGILNELGAQDRLLLSQTDYYNPLNSATIRRIIEISLSESELIPYINTFLLALGNKTLTPDNFKFKEEDEVRVAFKERGFEEFNERSKLPKEYGNCHYDGERYGVIKDEQGLVYSRDGKMVVSFDYSYNPELQDITVKDGVIAICEGAFEGYKVEKKNIHLPKTVRYFNTRSLAYNYKRLSWDSPWFKYKDGFIYTSDYTGCVAKVYVDGTIDKRVRIFESHLFEGIEFDGFFPNSLTIIKDNAFKRSTTPETVQLPETLCYLGNSAFEGVDTIKSIIIPPYVLYLGEQCFWLCKKLISINLKDCTGIKKIKRRTFCNCSNLQECILPNTIEVIDSSAFYGCGILTTINLSEGLTSIGEWAFYEAGLINVDLPKSITSIGSRAFMDCKNMQGSYNLDNVVELKESAFENCERLKELSINSVRVLESKVLCGCSRLEKISFDSLREMKEESLARCTKLIISLPSSLRTIDITALGCLKIEKSETSYYHLKGDALFGPMVYQRPTRLLYYFGDSERYEIPEGTNLISKNSFRRFPATLVIPNSLDFSCYSEFGNYHSKVIHVPSYRQSCNYSGFEGSVVVTNIPTWIDSYGVVYSEDKKSLMNFSHTLEIKKYIIDSNCKKICKEAFDILYDGDEDGTYTYGNQLEELVLPDGLEFIEDFALCGCVRLKSIKLSSSIKSIGENSLPEGIEDLVLPSNLNHIDCTAIPPSITNIVCKSENFKVQNGFLYSLNGTLIWVSPLINSLILPEEIKYIPKGSIKENIDKVYIPRGVEKIDEGALLPTVKEITNDSLLFSLKDDCLVSNDGVLLWVKPDIENLNIPKNISRIGAYSCSNRERINKINVPSGVTSIGEFAFSHCFRINEIWLPSSIVSIEFNALKSSQRYEGGNHKYLPYLVSTYPSRIYLPITDKERLTSLLSFISDDNIFCYYDTGVSEIDFETSWVDEYGVEYSEDRKRLLRFNKTEGLFHYEILEGTEIICDGAFCDFDNIRGKLEGRSEIKSLVIPSTVKAIGEAALACMNCEMLTLPDSVSFIGNHSFAGCYYLKNIKLSSNIDHIGEGAFWQCKKLEKINITDKLDTIEEYAFAGCESLVSVVIPDGVKSIKEGAFSGCYCLWEITLPQSINFISDNAFDNCGFKSLMNYKEDKERLMGAMFDKRQYWDPLLLYIPKGSASRIKEIIKNNKSLEYIKFLES